MCPGHCWRPLFGKTGVPVVRDQQACSHRVEMSLARLSDQDLVKSLIWQLTSFKTDVFQRSVVSQKSRLMVMFYLNLNRRDYS